MPDGLTVRGEVVKRRINPHRKFVCSLLPNWLLCRKEVSHGAKLTYARLCQFAGQNGDCFPSQQTIAREIGAAARSVRDYLSELEAYGLIERERRGLRRTSVYHFLHHHWIDDGKGNSSVQERQNPADRRESFEENPQKERRTTSSVDSGGTEWNFKPVATGGGSSMGSSVGSAAASGEAPAVPGPSSGGSGPSGIPADSGPEVLPTVQEVTDFWQRKIREESFLVEFFHRCVHHMHPEITIRTRMEYDLANARRLVEAGRAVITGANQPFAVTLQLILWYAEHQIAIREGCGHQPDDAVRLGLAGRRHPGADGKSQPVPGGGMPATRPDHPPGEGATGGHREGQGGTATDPEEIQGPQHRRGPADRWR